MLCFYTYMTDSAYQQIWIFDHVQLRFQPETPPYCSFGVSLLHKAIFGDSRCIPLESLFVGLHLCFSALDLPVGLHFHSRLCTWVRAHAHAMYRVTIQYYCLLQISAIQKSSSSKIAILLWYRNIAQHYMASIFSYGVLLLYITMYLPRCWSLASSPGPTPKIGKGGLVSLANFPVCAESAYYAAITCLMWSHGSQLLLTMVLQSRWTDLATERL